MMRKIPTLTNKIYNVGIYCRLSKDDGNIADSSSIINQKNYLTEFVNKNNWDIYNYYIDDGYSGTNFNRPAFNKLIEDIEKGLINCLVVKDMSRFGRNYLEVGQYTEDYFPKKGVRFIALNDNFDTVIDDNDFIPFKNIMNELYAKEVSKKIKTVFNQKRKDGTLLFKPPYGYKKDEIKGRVIDEEVAYIIKWIFEEYVKKHSKLSEIAEKLTQKQVLIPSAYYNLKHKINPDKYDISTKKEITNWTPKILLRIIKNEQYTGALVTNKVAKVSYKNNKTIELDKKYWIIHHDKFEPIIDKETYKLAQEMMLKNTKCRMTYEENKYIGTLKCGHCGKTFHFRTEKGIKGHICKTVGCYKNFIAIEIIDEILKNELLRLRDIIIKNELEIIAKINSFKSTDINHKLEQKESQIVELMKNKSIIVEKINKIFEAYISNELPEASYKNLSRKYRGELTEIESKIEIINSLPTESQYDPDTALNFIHNIKLMKSVHQITKTLINLFVDEIIITQGERINKIKHERNLTIYYRGLDKVLEEFINEKEVSIN